MSATTGWAVVSAAGEIDVATVSPSRRAAIVNWLFMRAGREITRYHLDDQIEGWWQKASAQSGVQVVEVSVERRAA